MRRQRIIPITTTLQGRCRHSPCLIATETREKGQSTGLGVTMTHYRYWLALLAVLLLGAGSVRIDAEVTLTADHLGVYPNSLSFEVPRHVSGVAVYPERCVVDLAWERCDEQELTVYIADVCRKSGAVVTFVFWFGNNVPNEKRYVSAHTTTRRSIPDPTHHADCTTTVLNMDVFLTNLARFMEGTSVLSAAGGSRFLAMRHLCRIDGTRDAVWALELIDETGNVPEAGPDQVAFLHFNNRLWLSGTPEEHHATGSDRLVRVPGTPGMSVQVLGPHDTQGMQVSFVSEPILGASHPLMLGVRTNAPCFCNASAMCTTDVATAVPSGTRAGLSQIAIGVPGPVSSFGVITRANFEGVFLFTSPLAVLVSGIAAFLSTVVFVFGCYLGCARRTILMRPTKVAVRALRDLGL